MVAELTGAQLVTGGEAVAEAMRQIDPDLVPVYPITPQTPIIQTYAKFVADGAATGEMIDVESEHSALSAAVGAALAGARAITATSSQGLALMSEVLFIAAGVRAPVVMAVGNRALSAPINIHGDHSDSMMVRDSGALQLFAESAQEAYDLMLVAPRVAEHRDVLLPVLVCLDGFTITHSAEPVFLVPDQLVKDFVGEYSIPDPLLAVHRPTTKGPFAMPDYFFELRRGQVAGMEAALHVLPVVASELEALTSRPLPLIEGYRLDNARSVLIALGSAAGTAKEVVDELRSEGQPVGLVKVISFRPFPSDLLRGTLAGIDRVGVVDRSLSPGGHPALFAEVAATMAGAPVNLRSFVAGLGGRDIKREHLLDAYRDLDASAADDRVHYLGLRSNP